MAAIKHISYLDSVRGLAALTVLSEHYVIAYGLPCTDQVCQKVLDNSPLHFWWDGGAAVSLFFVLSGLVLSLKYFHGDLQTNLLQLSLTRYIFGRIFRIWLPYLAVLTISASLYLEITDAPPVNTLLPASTWITDMWGAHPLTTLGMIREGFLLSLPTVNVLIPQAWTLSIELLLSLFLPIGIFLALKGSSWTIFFTLLAIVFFGAPVFLYHFMLGLLIARHYAKLYGFFHNKSWPRRLLLLIGFMLYSAGNVMPESVNETVLWCSSGSGAGLLLTYIMVSARSQTLLSFAVFRHIGRVSYSSYLLHMAVLICLTPRILAVFEKISVDRTSLWLAAWLATITCVQLISMLFYQVMEIPCIALGRRTIDYCLKPKRLSVAQFEWSEANNKIES